ncbi:AAEL012017-PA [Aedes aegypti]|uniref:AAEL012017-PA n=1 Tax=Aedes aegypti TaxID=7159 RepID=Q16ND0_AEDAE|nr:AAEL012017-PA [Aedes aegypti]
MTKTCSLLCKIRNENLRKHITHPTSKSIYSQFGISGLDGMFLNQMKISFCG